MAYMALSTSKPFYSKHRRKMIDQIMRGSVSYDKPGFKKISKDAKDFCKKLLVVDPKERMDAAKALRHPWITKREQLLDELPDQGVLELIDDCLIHYKHTSQLKKLALNVIAHRSTTQEILQLRKVFDSFDKEKNGILSYAEFKSALDSMNYSQDDTDEMFRSLVSLFCFAGHQVEISRTLCQSMHLGCQSKRSHHVHGVSRCND